MEKSNKKLKSYWVKVPIFATAEIRVEGVEDEDSALAIALDKDYTFDDFTEYIAKKELDGVKIEIQED